MATKRCIPTTFFEDPDVVELKKNEQLILIGLVTDADDSGRGLANSRLLGRKLDFEPEQIEQALTALEHYDFVQCYQVGRHSYYSLCRWEEWQSLSKPTPSKYPAPPLRIFQDVSQDPPEIPKNPQGNFGEFREIPPEGEGEGEKEEKRTEGEEEGIPPNVVNFPTTRSDDSTHTLPEHKIIETTKQVASILKLPVTPALIRIAEEYINDPALSLLCEADAAREWIDDRQRNSKGKRMSPAFYRRWLKREHEDVLRRQTQAYQANATGTNGRKISTADATATLAVGASLPRSLMHLADEYDTAQQGGNR